MANRIPDDVRRRVREMLAEGGHSHRGIARATGVSFHSVQNIRDAMIVGETELPEPPVTAPTRRFDPTDPAYRAPTIAKLRRRAMSLSELRDFLGVTEAQAQDMIQSLAAAGHTVEQTEAGFAISGTLRPDTVPIVIDTSRLRTPQRAIGVVADTHLASTCQRLDVLEMAYDEFARAKVEFVIHAGNAVDGFLDRINGDSVLFRNAQDQLQYLADHYPSRQGIKTRFITGSCHEGWWAKSTGLDIGMAMQNTAEQSGRSDLEYIGHTERDIEFRSGTGKVVLRVFHPGGGSAYAQSYKPQKIVESYQGGEKPHILVIGHYHKLGCFYPRGVWTVLAGCCQDQTRWMRGRHIDAHVGFGVMRFRQDKYGGISGFTFEQFPFYDRGYHIDAGEWTMAVGHALGN